MKRTLVALCLCAALVVPLQVRASDSFKQALSHVPADAVLVVCAPNVGQIDAHFGQALKTLGLEEFLPPPMNKPSAILTQKLNITEGFDEKGPLAMVLLPIEVPAEFMQRHAVILPATDPEALLKSMGGSVGDDGGWTVSIEEEVVHAAPGDKCVVMGQFADTVKTIAGAKENLAGKLSAEDLKTLEGLDLVVWADWERLYPMAKVPLDGFMGMAMMAQAQSGPVAAAQMEMSKKQMDMLFTGMSTIGIGIGLDEPGLTMRFAMSAKPGSEFAERVKVAQPTQPLFAGLPGGDYLLAFGATVSPEASRAAVKDYDPLLAALEKVEGVDAELLGKLKSALHEWAPMATAMSASFTALPAGPDGMIGATMLVHTPDSGKWISLMRDAASAALKLVSAEELDLGDEFTSLISALSHTPDAEEIGGAKVDRLKLDLTKIEAIDEEDIEDVLAVIGKDGLLVRVAPAGPKAVLIVFGGGAKYFGSVLEQAAKGESPLESDAGIRKVLTHLPKDKYSAGFVQVDRILALAGEIMKVVEEDEEFPLSMPKLEAPVALSGSGGDNFGRADIFVPTELMVAVKDLVMKMTGMAGGPPPQEEEEEAAPTGDEEDDD